MFRNSLHAQSVWWKDKKRSLFKHYQVGVKYPTWDCWVWLYYSDFRPPCLKGLSSLGLMWKKNALLWFKFFISYFICWWGWVRPKPNRKFGPWAMIFEWPGLVYHGMLSMTPPSLEFFFQIRLYMVYLHLRLAIFLYQWHCWSIFTVKNHFSYSKIFFNVKCWKIGYQSNIWSVLVLMTLSCYATNLTLFRIYSGTDTKLFIIL